MATFCYFDIEHLISTVTLKRSVTTQKTHKDVGPDKEAEARNGHSLRQQKKTIDEKFGDYEEKYHLSQKLISSIALARNLSHCRVKFCSLMNS